MRFPDDKASRVQKGGIEPKRERMPSYVTVEHLAVVAPAGFEPAISALRGLRPRPLDDGATYLVGGVGVEPTTSRV